MKQSVAVPPTEEKQVSLIKAYYILTLLMLVWALQFANSSIINVVLEPIKKEFALSDTVIGLMVGFGFVLIGSLLSMPVARLADRKGRVSITAIGVAFWSVMAVLGGLAQSAVQLLLTRIGVGIGSSTAVAPGNSLIADYFPRNKLPMAMAVLSIAPCVGGLVAFLVGGIVGTYWGWRYAFYLVGIPGFIITALLFLTVKEPRRGLQDGKAADIREYGLGETLRYLITNKTYILLVFGFSFSGFADLTFNTWFVAYMMRVHQMSMLQVSTIGGILNSIGGMIGVLLGGAIVGHLGKKDDRWKATAPAITSFLAGPALVIFLFAPLPWAWIFLFGSLILMCFRMGPLLGIIQGVVKVRMRAFAAATIFMIGTIFGSGVGPLAIGVINDHLDPTYGSLSIRYSLLIVPLMSMLAALFYYWASRHVKEDLQKSMSEQ
jgi:MFS family permease